MANPKLESTRGERERASPDDRGPRGAISAQCQLGQSTLRAASIAEVEFAFGKRLQQVGNRILARDARNRVIQCLWHYILPSRQSDNALPGPSRREPQKAPCQLRKPKSTKRLSLGYMRTEGLQGGMGNPYVIPCQ